MYGYNAEPPIAIPIYTVLPYCVIGFTLSPLTHKMCIYRNDSVVHSRMDTQWCIITLTRIVSDLANYDGGRCIGVDLLDAYHVQLELVYRELIGMEVLGGLRNAVSVEPIIYNFYDIMQNLPHKMKKLLHNEKRTT